MDRRRFLKLAGASTLALPASAALTTQAAHAAPADTLPARSAVIATVRKVNDYWINTHPSPGANTWDPATYYSGAMAAYRLTREPNYLDYTRAWAESHSYGLNGGVTTRVADNHCAGQAYLDLYEELGGEEKIAAIEESLHRMVYTDQPEKNDDWWWVDALHMAMPPFARLSVLRGDPEYARKMYDLYYHTKQVEGGGLYDYDWELWYRDSNYAPGGAKHLSPNGLPVFWSRGDGWAHAAHAKVLSVLPANDPHVQEYRNNLAGLARGLAPYQRSDGFWNPSLVDPDHYGSKETSGTAFFTFAMAWGIRAGILNRTTYLPVVARAWNGMVADAVREDGFLGWVQNVGAEPAPVSADSTRDFGVGAFLMAGSEVARLTS